MCVESGVSDPYLIAVVPLVGAFAGAEIMYKSDYDVHNAVFVDHLNTSGSGSSYTNWYNKKTGNSGIIHITKSHMKDLSSVKIMTLQLILLVVGH